MNKQDKLKERLSHFLPKFIEDSELLLTVPNRVTVGAKPTAVSDTLRNLIYDKFSKNLELLSFEIKEHDSIYKYKIIQT